MIVNNKRKDVEGQENEKARIKREVKEHITVMRWNTSKRACVRKACLHCQNTHKKCSNERPCQRCVEAGVECVEPQPKPKPSNKKVQYTSEFIDEGFCLRMNTKNKRKKSSNTEPPGPDAAHFESSPEHIFSADGSAHSLSPPRNDTEQVIPYASSWFGQDNEIAGLYAWISTMPSLQSQNANLLTEISVLEQEICRLTQIRAILSMNKQNNRSDRLLQVLETAGGDIVMFPRPSLSIYNNYPYFNPMKDIFDNMKLFVNIPTFAHSQLFDHLFDVYQQGPNVFLNQRFIDGTSLVPTQLPSSSDLATTSAGSKAKEVQFLANPFLAIFEHSSVGISITACKRFGELVTDTRVPFGQALDALGDSPIIGCNDAFARTLDMSAEEVKSRGWRYILPPIDYDKFLWFRLMFSDRGNFTIPYMPWFDKNGDFSIANVTISILRDQFDVPQFFITHSWFLQRVPQREMSEFYKNQLLLAARQIENQKMPTQG